MKKIIFALIFGLVLLFGTQITYAAQSDINIIINSRRVEFTEETGFPFLDENNRTMVPLRVTMETAGFSVGFDSEQRVAIVITEHRRIEVHIDEDFMYVNNDRVQNDTYAVIVDGRTFLPIRAVLEAAGFTVEWHNPSSSVNAFLFEWHEDMFVPFSTSSLETLVRNILNGSVVVIDGRYYSTPERMRMYLDTRVNYLSDDLNTSILPRQDRFALANTNITFRPAIGEWISQLDLSRNYGVNFSTGIRIEGERFLNFNLWQFVRGNEQLLLIHGMTDDFSRARNADEINFDGIRIRRVNGNFSFNREDLIRASIIE